VVRPTHTTSVHFFIGTYHDYADCDVVLIQACSLLLGQTWEFDTDAVHHGRSNKYTLVNKGKKNTLLLMTPTEIVQCDRTITKTAKRESETQQHTTANPLSSNAIKLKRRAMIAAKSEFAAPPTVGAPFHALVCR
jgi:hypothetical protein